MISDAKRENLSRKYSIVGSHSAVKLCRWQKADLRGQASCYKHSGYGIRSAQCVEATPSTGCANKCVYCWRLNTNPLVVDSSTDAPESKKRSSCSIDEAPAAAVAAGVGAGDSSNGAATVADWNFAMDDPVELVDKIIKQHQAMVYELRHLADVTEEQLGRAMTPRHCALSLVGEPIIYPRINDFCHELHLRRISSFLVNNGQFPRHQAALKPVTQFYLSIDSTTPEMMRAVARPAHADFWERHFESLRLMRERRDRTVFRMTCIKQLDIAQQQQEQEQAAAEGGKKTNRPPPPAAALAAAAALAGGGDGGANHASPPLLIGNMSDADVERLAEMVRIARPHFIELKQLTPAFQGTSTASSHALRIGNVPTWGDMRDFAHKLRDALRDIGYGIPVVHEHSTCIILAQKAAPYYVDGRWRTWIDFDKFGDLVLRDRDARTWSFADYTAETPDWALLGSDDIPAAKTEGYSRKEDGTIVLDRQIGTWPGHERKMSGRMKKRLNLE